MGVAGGLLGAEGDVGPAQHHLGPGVDLADEVGQPVGAAGGSGHRRDPHQVGLGQGGMESAVAPVQAGVAVGKDVHLEASLFEDGAQVQKSHKGQAKEGVGVELTGGLDQDYALHHYSPRAVGFEAARGRERPPAGPYAPVSRYSRCQMGSKRRLSSAS